MEGRRTRGINFVYMDLAWVQPFVVTAQNARSEKRGY